MLPSHSTSLISELTEPSSTQSCFHMVDFAQEEERLSFSQRLQPGCQNMTKVEIFTKASLLLTVSCFSQLLLDGPVASGNMHVFLLKSMLRSKLLFSWKTHLLWLQGCPKERDAIRHDPFLRGSLFARLHGSFHFHFFIKLLQFTIVAQIRTWFF